ncbi:hypothetical protein ACWFRM_43210, partial [Streptomyces sp. NPDC055144]
GFVERYHQAVEDYQDQLAAKRLRKEDARRREVLKAVSWRCASCGADGPRQRAGAHLCSLERRRGRP